MGLLSSKRTPRPERDDDNGAYERFGPGPGADIRKYSDSELLDQISTAGVSTSQLTAELARRAVGPK